MAIEESVLSRRGFLKGAAVLAAGAAVAGVAGCSKADAATESWMPEKWDAETDMVAIGAGGAGLAAAVEAGDQGMSIIVLEHQPMVGGNSAICNGGMCCPGSPLQKEQGIEDSAEIMYNDLITYIKHDADKDYLKTLSEQQARLWDWLTGMGVQFKKEGLIATTGQSRAREHHVKPSEVIKALNDNAKAKGADIRLNTKATKFIQHPVSKRILGVVATAEDGSTINIKAKKAVLLCSGGYARNVEMLNKWVFGEGADDYVKTTYDALGQDGSGILMAMEIGAQTRHIDYINMLTAQNPKGKIGDACSMYHVGAVLVNKEGKRYVNEAQGYIGVWTETDAQTDNVCFQVWDEPIAAAYAENDSSYYSMKKIIATGLMLKANTLQELAGLMGVPADAFVATMNKYNGDVAASGKDSEFGRETLVSMAGKPLALKTPPFYAFETTNALVCTKGGIAQDKTGQAVDVTGKTIPGLYLAGNVSGYCNFGIVPGTRQAVNTSGVGFGGAIALGRWCAEQIAKLDNWDAEKA